MELLLLLLLSQNYPFRQLHIINYVCWLPLFRVEAAFLLTVKSRYILFFRLDYMVSTFQQNGCLIIFLSAILRRHISKVQFRMPARRTNGMAKWRSDGKEIEREREREERGGRMRRAVKHQQHKSKPFSWLIARLGFLWKSVLSAATKRLYNILLFNFLLSIFLAQQCCLRGVLANIL